MFFQIKIKVMCLVLIIYLFGLVCVAVSQVRIFFVFSFLSVFCFPRFSHVFSAHIARIKAGFLCIVSGVLVWHEFSHFVFLFFLLFF